MLLVSLAATASAAIEKPAALRAALAREMRGGRRILGRVGPRRGLGPHRLRVEAAQRRVPASVQKLITTATALDRLGTSARFETAVLADGEVARGDARGRPLPAWVRRPDVRHEGAQQACGPRRRHGPRACRRTRLRRRELLRPAAGRPGQRLRDLALRRAAVRTGIQPRARSCRSAGAGRPTRLRSPRTACVRRCGVRTSRFRSRCARRRRPPDARQVAAVESPSLRSIVHHTNHVSDNYYAEMLLKGLGARVGGEGSTVGGRSRRALVRARGRLQHEGRGRVRALAREPRGTPRRRAATARRPQPAVVRRVLQVAPARGQDGNPRQAHARNARRGPLPGEDGNALRRHRARGLLQGAGRRLASRSRCS